MVFAFDTLSYARFLREHGVLQEQAEAHAEAARQFIMAELVTKTDLQMAVTQLETKMENLSLRLSVRLGMMFAAGIGALAALVKLT
jgi:hypothetical protein